MTSTTSPELRALQTKLTGPFDPVLAANGAAVILAYRPGADGVTALAWRRVLRAPSAADPALEQFADYWLGRGARVSEHGGDGTLRIALCQMNAVVGDIAGNERAIRRRDRPRARRRARSSCCSPSWR